MGSLDIREVDIRRAANLLRHDRASVQMPMLVHFEASSRVFFSRRRDADMMLFVSLISPLAWRARSLESVTRS